MRKVLSVFVALCLVLSLFTGVLTSVPKARAATSWYVDPLGTDDGTHGTTTGAGAFKTIQYAINDTRVVAGDTINVEAGTYSENVTVNKALTLAGASSASVIVTSAVDADSVFTVTANNVTISRFTARHTTMTGNEGYAGIKFASGVTGCSIHDNILVNNQYGILLQDPENTTTPGNNTFTSNTASSNGVSGIEMQHTYGNTFTTNTANLNGSYGFRLDGASNNTFTSNTASLNTVSGFSLVKGSSTGGCLNNTFTNNTANSNTQYGLREDYGDHNTLTGNIFNANVLAGLRLKEVLTNLTVEHNSITNSPIGIDVAAPVTNVTTWTVEHNNISGNTTAGISNLGTGTLTAASNWWGNASGPHNDTSNPSGTGDAVSSNVTFCQWALSSAMTTFNTLAVATASLPTGTSGVSYSQALQGSGGMLPYTWTIFTGSLPDGLTLTTGTISGTPTVPGVFPFTVQLTSVCGTPTKALTITVNPVITASAGTGGTITPTGAVAVVRGTDRSFAIAASVGYSVVDVVVDGVSQGARSSYTFTNVTANHTIAATFVPGVLTYVIAATAISGGSISPSGDVSVAQFGSQLFTITPTTGYRIVDVVVDAVSKGALASYTFTNVTAYHTIAVTFAINTYTIVASAGSGGSISPSGNVVVNHGSSRLFTVTPSTGRHVLDVLVDGVTAGAVTTYTFTNVTAAHTIAATFAINTYTLTYTAGANGTISGASPQTVNHGASGTAVTAVPSTGYHFVQWSDTTTSNPRTDTNVTANVSVTAAFAPDAYTLTVAPPVNGTVARNPDQATYAYGASVTLTATPAFGYAFTSWSGDLTGSANPTTMTMTGNKTVTATFAVAPPRILNISVTGSGFVVKSPNLSSYPSGTVVTLTATPLAGHTFTGWSGDLTGTTNPTTITVSANKTVTATFAPIPTYTLTTTASPSLGGTIGKSPNLSSYPSGTVVTLTATPAFGYAFTGWSGDLTGTTNPTTLTMDANKTVTATFTAVFSFPLSLSAGWNLISVPVPLPVSSITGFQSGYGYHNDWSDLLSTDSLVPGEGYWIQVEHAVVISLTGTPGTAPVPLTYLTGWQLMGNPFDVPIHITSITNHELILVCYSYGPTWRIVDLTTGVLQPGKGCWIQLSAPTTLTLMHP